MKKSIVVILLFFVISLPIQSQNIDVLGYLPIYRFAEFGKIDFSMVTHVDIAFANPDKNGIIKPSGPEISEVVSKLKQKDVIVYVSLGGAAVTGQKALNWKKYMSSSERSEFIKNIKNYCLVNGFRGVDMDLEWDNVTNLYSPFVLELKDTLDKYNLGFTAALPGTYRYPEISKEALKVFDVVNLMAYDFRGSWTPNNPGQHSSYNDADKSIKYWRKQGLDSEKMRLGVPFYGYDFTNINNITSFGYGEIVEDNIENAYFDKVGEKYYNGINTIKRKAVLVKDQKLKGIMIWELGQDAFSPLDDYSLLKAIHDIRLDMVNIDAKSNEVLFFPNPFKDSIIIELTNSENANTVELIITDVRGRVVFNKFISTGEVELNKINKGVFFYRLKTARKVYRGVLLKR